MTIDALAEKYRLKITRDECNNKIVQGRRGHLYIDAGKVCAMWLDAQINPRFLAMLGGKQWVSEFTLNARRHRLRDAKIIGIKTEKIPLAIRLAGIKLRRIMSEAQRAVLDRAHAASPAQFHKESHTHDK